MRHTPADLDLTRRHVEEGERLVVDQRRIINRLMSRGAPTGEAFELLKQMLVALENMRKHLREIEASVSGGNFPS